METPSSLEPFSQCIETTFPRKQGTCYLTKKKLKKNEKVFCFTFGDYGNVTLLYAKKDAFLKSEYGAAYKNKFLKKAYTLKEDFVGHLEDIVDACPSLDKYVFNFEKGLSCILKPPKFTRKKSIVNDELYLIYQLRILLGIYIQCGYGSKILKNIETHPKYSWILCALSNDLRIQKKVATLINVPELPHMLDILNLDEWGLTEIMEVIEFSKKYPQCVKLIMQCIERYDIHLSHSVPPYGFTRLDKLHNARLCYFFIANPEKMPLLEQYIKTKKGLENDPSGEFTYVESFYYQAAIMHFLISGKITTAQKWADEMEEHIYYYWTGSPRNFIKKTKKLVEEYMLKYT